MRFVYQGLLWFLMLLPLALFFLFRNRKKRYLQFSNVSMLGSLQKGVPLLPLLSTFFKLLAIFFFVLGAARFARVQYLDTNSEVSAIDILFTVDISTSMEQFSGNQTRIQLAAEALQSLLEISEKERAGLVVFVENAYTVMPLSFDHQAILYYALNLPNYPGSISDGTAIWDALLVSADRLQASRSKSRVILLVTDGANNTGIFTSDEVEERLLDMGVSLYAIQIGQFLQFPSTERNEVYQLERLCENTAGGFFELQKANALRNVTREIGKLEKNKIERRQNFEFFLDYYQVFFTLALISCGLFLNLDIALARGIGI